MWRLCSGVSKDPTYPAAGWVSWAEEGSNLQNAKIVVGSLGPDTYLIAEGSIPDISYEISNYLRQ